MCGVEWIGLSNQLLIKVTGRQCPSTRLVFMATQNLLRKGDFGFWKGPSLLQANEALEAIDMMPY